MHWQTKTFEELSTDELFEIFELRQSVFVVEQECAYPDIDAADKLALHLLGYLGEENSTLQLYARLLKPGVSYESASIGRVIVAKDVRGNDYGRQLMQHAITEVEKAYPGHSIMIGAQDRLEQFYVSLGFKRVSETYIEDGIPHLKMLRDKS